MARKQPRPLPKKSRRSGRKTAKRLKINDEVLKKYEL